MQHNYNHGSNTVKSLKRKRRGDGTFWDEKKNLNISSNTKDIIATLYHIRNLDIHNASIGNSDTFTVLMDNEEFKITITLLAKETINTNIGRKECYKLAISSSNSNVLQGQNNNLIWLTADANKIIVYGKFKIPVGNGELKIKSASGLKN